MAYGPGDLMFMGGSNSDRSLSLSELEAAAILTSYDLVDSSADNVFFGSGIGRVLHRIAMYADDEAAALKDLDRIEDITKAQFDLAMARARSREAIGASPYALSIVDQYRMKKMEQVTANFQTGTIMDTGYVGRLLASPSGRYLACVPYTNAPATSGYLTAYDMYQTPHSAIYISTNLVMSEPYHLVDMAQWHPTKDILAYVPFNASSVNKMEFIDFSSGSPVVTALNLNGYSAWNPPGFLYWSFTGNYIVVDMQSEAVLVSWNNGSPRIVDNKALTSAASGNIRWFWLPDETLICPSSSANPFEFKNAYQIINDKWTTGSLPESLRSGLAIGGYYWSSTSASDNPKLMTNPVSPTTPVAQYLWENGDLREIPASVIPNAQIGQYADQGRYAVASRIGMSTNSTAIVARVYDLLQPSRRLEIALDPPPSVTIGSEQRLYNSALVTTPTGRHLIIAGAKVSFSTPSARYLSEYSEA